MTSVAPGLDAGRKAFLKARVLFAVGDEAALLGGRWVWLLPGVRYRLLHRDGPARIQTALWRLAPGARIPGHRHRQDEECEVLAGTLLHRGQRFQAGDSMLAPAGSSHGSIRSPEGALMLIRGEILSMLDRWLLRIAAVLSR